MKEEFYYNFTIGLLLFTIYLIVVLVSCRLAYCYVESYRSRHWEEVGRKEGYQGCIDEYKTWVKKGRPANEIFMREL
jgi:hypothetical protein